MVIRKEIEELMSKQGEQRTKMLLHSSYITDNWARYKSVATLQSQYSSPNNRRVSAPPHQMTTRSGSRVASNSRDYINQLSVSDVSTPFRHVSDMATPPNQRHRSFQHDPRRGNEDHDKQEYPQVSAFDT